MSRIILFGMIVLVASACGKGKRPEGILTEKQMVHVMTELYIAEEKTSRLPIPYDSTRKIFPMFSAKAFEKAGVSDSVFRKSLDYYMREPEKLEHIYTVLVDSLNLKAQRADAHTKGAAP
ncbi:MAG TPA: DUF4296 domain-containing protein [Cyclobacteriaceae bacterium]|nr:DUF4296 domain-containing protein [Cyclobacteriaceae bacterium]